MTTVPGEGAAPQHRHSEAAMRGRCGIRGRRTRGAWRWVVVAVSGVVVGGVMALAADHLEATLRHDWGDPPYTVAALRQMVAQNPKRWMGRTVRVQGVVVAYRQRRDSLDGWVLLAPPRLTDPGGQGSWLLVWGPPDPLLAWLRSVPLLGRVVPAAQTVSWGRVAIYRIQLRKMAGRVCPERDAAVLVDAAG